MGATAPRWFWPKGDIGRLVPRAKADVLTPEQPIDELKVLEDWLTGMQDRQKTVPTRADRQLSLMSNGSILADKGVGRRRVTNIILNVNIASVNIRDNVRIRSLTWSLQFLEKALKPM